MILLRLLLFVVAMSSCSGVAFGMQRSSEPRVSAVTYVAHQEKSDGPEFPHDGVVSEAGLKKVLTAAKESIADFSSLDQLTQEMYGFFEYFVLQIYIRTITSVKARADLEDHPIASWSDVMHLARMQGVSMKRRFEQERVEYYRVLGEEYNITLDEQLDAPYAAACVMFFHALYIQFEQRNCGEEFLYWLSVAAPIFYQKLIEAYPQLSLTQGTYKDKTEVSGGRPVLATLGSVFNLSELTDSGE